jgi:hypothetical protein
VEVDPADEAGADEHEEELVAVVAAAAQVTRSLRS